MVTASVLAKHYSWPQEFITLRYNTICFVTWGVITVRLCETSNGHLRLFHTFNVFLLTPTNLYTTVPTDYLPWCSFNVWGGRSQYTAYK